MKSKKKSAPAEPLPKFEELGLDERLLEQLEVMGFEMPTPIQAAAMPPLLVGADIIGRARTGSGKTAAFGLPLLDRLKDGGSHVRALVLTPTRELANQIGEALREHSRKLPDVHGITIYGGAPYGPQIKALKQGCNVVVATPGRVIDLLEKGALNLSKLEMFVLDEGAS
jgi:ATP-dependent RNA helicase DeaD